MDEIKINQGQSVSLSNFVDEYTTSCSDYVKYKKMQRRCVSIFENMDLFFKIFKTSDYKHWILEKEFYIERTDTIFNRANSRLILDFWHMHLKLNDQEFVKYVLKKK